MGGLPDALFVIDVEHERIAVTEANNSRFRLSESLTRTATKAWMRGFRNDDAIRAIQLYASVVADACMKAQNVMVLRAGTVNLLKSTKRPQQKLLTQWMRRQRKPRLLPPFLMNLP